MKWSFIFFLPAIVSVLWGLAIMLLKRHPSRSQMLLSLTLLLVGFAIGILEVFFRGRAGALFIYDFVFEVAAVLCAPVYYMGICALVEPRGSTRHQRQVFHFPLLFIIGLTVGAFWLGPRRYEAMCYALREGGAAMIAGDAKWNYMLFWDHWLFPILVMVMSFILIVMANGKVNEYQRRFNGIYAENIDLPFINNRVLSLFSWLLLPLGVLVVLMIDLRPHNYKYWLIGCSVLLTILQFYIGRFAWRLDYDARYLAEYVRKKIVS